MRRRHSASEALSDHPLGLALLVGFLVLVGVILWIWSDEYALAASEAGTVPGFATLLAYIWSLAFPVALYGAILWNSSAGVAQSPFGERQFISTVTFVAVGVVLAIFGYWMTNAVVIPSTSAFLYSMIGPNVGSIVLYAVGVPALVLLSAFACVAVALPSGVGQFFRSASRSLED